MAKPSSDGSASPGRPSRFNYLFYIDFVGALSDPNCQNALRHLQVRGAAAGARVWSRQRALAACNSSLYHAHTACLHAAVRHTHAQPPHPHTPDPAQESAPFMRVLGSYPMETSLGGLDSNTPFDSINDHE